jgi:hypothetical protein
VYQIICPLWNKNIAQTDETWSGCHSPDIAFSRSRGSSPSDMALVTSGSPNWFLRASFGRVERRCTNFCSETNGYGRHLDTGQHFLAFTIRQKLEAESQASRIGFAKVVNWKPATARTYAQETTESKPVNGTDCHHVTAHFTC